MKRERSKYDTTTVIKRERKKRGRETKKERETERETEKETYRNRLMKLMRERKMQRDREKHRETEIQTDRQMIYLSLGSTAARSCPLSRTWRGGTPGTDTGYSSRHQRRSYF